MLPDRLDANTDPCDLSNRWKLDIRLAVSLQLLGQMVRSNVLIRGPDGSSPVLSIISGWRSHQHQLSLCGQIGHERPCADPDSSTHTSCPATGADLRIEGTSEDLWPIIGGMWERMGWRWGGRFSHPDPNHFDLGPRQ